MWADHPRFVKYDFHKPLDVSHTRHTHSQPPSPPADCRLTPPTFVHLVCLSCQIPAALQHTFDYVVIDPPFITDDVWQLYAQTAHLLLTAPTHSDGPVPRILLSTIPENLPLLSSLLSVHLCRFRPSIPHLPYQYSFFTNYDSERLSALNAEIDDDEWSEQHTARKKTNMESYSSEQMLAEEQKQKHHTQDGQEARRQVQS